MEDFVCVTIKCGWSFIRLCDALMNPTLPLSFYWQSKLVTTDPPLPPSQKRILHPPHRAINNNSSCCYMTQISIDTSTEKAGLLWIWSSSTPRELFRCALQCNQLASISDEHLPRYVHPIVNPLHRPPPISYNFSTKKLVLYLFKVVFFFVYICVCIYIYIYIYILLWSLSIMTRLILEAIFILSELMPISVHQHCGGMFESINGTVGAFETWKEFNH